MSNHDLFPEPPSEPGEPQQPLFEELREPVYVRVREPGQARPKRSGGAQRQARHRERRAENGVSQINVVAHEDFHGAIRDLARRSVTGQSLVEAVAEISHSAPVSPPEPRSTPRPGASPAALYATGWRAAVARWLLGVSRPIDASVISGDRRR